MHLCSSFRLIGLAVVAAAGLLWPGAAAHGGSSGTTVSIALAPAFGGGNGASGVATHIDKGKRELFEVEVAGLSMGIYDLYVGGGKVGEIDVLPDIGETEGEIRFDTKRKKGALRLNFDPRGKTIEVRNSFNVLLSGVLPAGSGGGNGGGSNPQYSNYGDTIQSAAPGTGRRPTGTLKIRSSRKEAWMRFEFNRLALEPHTITANGVTIAGFSPFPGGMRSVQFSTSPSNNDFTLDFDPAGVTYQVLDADGDFVMEFIADPGTIGGGMEPVRLSTAPLIPTGIQLGAMGAATLESRGTRLDFTVEVQNVMPGSYDVRIDGVSQGTLTVTSGGGMNGGEVALSNYRSGIGILPLTRDPRGKLVEVVGASAVVLKVVYPST